MLHTLSIANTEQRLAKTVWSRLEATAYQNFQKVLEAFTRYRVGEEHFSSVTGYGHGDLGRETLDKVFAHALQAESALVRFQFVSGTHALAVALNGCLKAGDVILSLTGRPYDTLEEVIGLRDETPQSLTGKGVVYQELDVLESGVFSPVFTAPQEALIRKSAMLYIQRSRGYGLRPTLTTENLAELCQMTRALNPDAIIMVDNCYGEFTQTQEPTAIGADLIAGSLIKNPGGGIVPTGGYIAGRADLVEASARVLTCPGIGSHGGYTFDLARLAFQGLFSAPSVVHDALKGMTLAAALFEEAGYAVTPSWEEVRSDIIQVIRLGTPEKLVRFCETLQRVSPVNSAITPIPAAVPGYESQVVMAGGTFIEGATLELSADGPLREPYAVFLQGGLNYLHTRYALEQMLKAL